MKKKKEVEIVVYQQSVYGRTLMYVQDADIARNIVTLTGKLTVDMNDIAALRALGHTVSIIALPEGNGK